MNINQIINAKDANMDILKQKMKNVFIVALSKMVGLDVLIVDMKLTLMELKQIRLFAKSVIMEMLHSVVPTMVKYIFLILSLMNTLIHFYHKKENVMIAKLKFRQSVINVF